MNIFWDDYGVRDWVSIVVTALEVILLLIVIAIPLGLIDRNIQIKQCKKIQEQGVDSKYTGYWTGCYVKVNGRFIPIDNWRGESND